MSNVTVLINHAPSLKLNPNINPWALHCIQISIPTQMQIQIQAQPSTLQTKPKLKIPPSSQKYVRNRCQQFFHKIQDISCFYIQSQAQTPTQALFQAEPSL